MIANLYNKYLVVILLLISVVGRSQTVAEGRFTFNQADLDREGFIDLRVKWEYYDKVFLAPSVFAQENAPKPSDYLLLRDNQTYVAKNLLYGYGTYRLVVESDIKRPITIKIAEFRSAFKFFIDGKKVVEHGTIGTSLEEEVPLTAVNSIHFQPNGEKIEFVFHNSNFHLPSRVSNYQFKIGDTNAIEKAQRQVSFNDAWVMGSILIMAFYHFALYLMRRENKAPLGLRYSAFWSPFELSFAPMVSSTICSSLTHLWS